MTEEADVNSVFGTSWYLVHLIIFVDIYLLRMKCNTLQDVFIKKEKDWWKIILCQRLAVGLICNEKKLQEEKKMAFFKTAYSTWFTELIYQIFIFHISYFIIKDKRRGDQMKYLALCDISYRQHLHFPL